jgi:ferric-dicitrate binding protein FerR (iron transport regulator)/DNA-directed RNA polymerase specialized sigma24 family protein
MTLDEYRVELSRLVAETGSLRKLASRHLKGADADDVAQHVLIELSLLCPELIAGMRELRPYAGRAIRYRVLDLVKEQNRATENLDIADPRMDAEPDQTTGHIGEGVLLQTEEDRERLRAAVSLLDRRERAVIAAMLQTQSIPVKPKRVGTAPDVARAVQGRSLGRLREIIAMWSRTSQPGSHNSTGDSDQSCTDTFTQAVYWLTELYNSEEMAPLLPQFHAWLNATPENRHEYLSLEQIWRLLIDLGDRGLLNDSKLATLPTRKVTADLRWTRAVVAASVFVSVLAGAILYGHSQHPALPAACDTLTDWHQNPSKVAQGSFASALGRTPTLELADGSQITLNANSQVTLDLTACRRHIQLDRGEALFKVSKGHAVPFDVQVGTTTVRAVGTIFSVEEKGLDGAATAVQEGKVVVLTKEHAALLVEAGQIAELGADGVHVHEPDTSEVDRRLMWTAGFLSFDREPLAAVADEFNRYNRSKISVDPDIAGLLVGGTFRATDPDRFAELLHEALGIERTFSRDPQSAVETIHLSRKKIHSN